MYPTGERDEWVVAAEILDAVQHFMAPVPTQAPDAQTPPLEKTQTQQPATEGLRAAIMTALSTDRARRERRRVPPNDDMVLTAAETAKLLGLSRFTLLRMRQRPDAAGLPFIQLSEGRIGYRSRDIEAFLAFRRIGRLLDEPDTTAAERRQPPASRAMHPRGKKKRSGSAR